jgi:hypothetical protein
MPDELWDWWHERSKEKRADNRAASTQMLRERGLAFDERNGGAHLIVRVPDGRVFDFWPGTGLWKQRGGDGAQRRGVERLLRTIGGAP